ncbi:hypothetical protein [Catellatospora tritici]|uniref:hypothetical protein n=1 Tax=Catellatospora tritici TaxID=2851566 RepID=UPI001C2D1552|nr:hypothetical protein [Catellatospora tritici]MBV1855553.1 hypothetical protein [Catellatospora tritici]
MPITLPGSRALARRLLWAVAALHFASFAVNVLYHAWGVGHGERLVGWLTTFVNVDHRQNLPSWFASGVLLVTACVLWEIANAVTATGEIRFRRHWRILSLVFALLSVDNLADAHQVLRSSHLAAIGAASSWLLILAPLVVVFAASYLRFLLHLPARTRMLIIAAGGLYVAGVGAMEAVGVLTGYHVPVALPGQALSGGPFLRHLVGASLEELLQMLGSVALLYAVSTRLEHYRHTVTAIAPVQARIQPAANPGRTRLTRSAAGDAGGSTCRGLVPRGRRPGRGARRTLAACSTCSRSRATARCAG